MNMNCSNPAIEHKVSECCWTAQKSALRDALAFLSYLTCCPQSSLLHVTPWHWQTQQCDDVCQEFLSTFIRKTSPYLLQWQIYSILLVSQSIITKQILLIIYVCACTHLSKYAHTYTHTQAQIIKSNSFLIFVTLCFICHIQMDKNLSVFASSSWHIQNWKRFIHTIIKWIKIEIHISWSPEPRSPSKTRQHYCMISGNSLDKSARFISYNAMNFLKRPKSSIPSIYFSQTF